MIKRVPASVIVSLTALALLSPALVLSLPASAGLKCSVDDPDVTQFKPKFNFEIPDYYNLIAGSVEKKRTTFNFGAVLSADLPDAPATPDAMPILAWIWVIDTDPATAPFGYPFGDGSRGEFTVLVVWDSNVGTFSGFVVDRRPLLEQKAPIITPVSFAISGPEVSASVPADLIDNPSSFNWGILWLLFPLLGSDGWHIVDTIVPFVPWPC